MSAESLTLVPSWRLGALLRDARDRDHRNLDVLASRSDRFDLEALVSVEAGTRSLSDDDLEHLVALYGIDPVGLVPDRTDLVVDLDHNELATAGHTEPLAGSAPTADEVLASYLSLVYTLRSMQPGTPVPLRDADLDVLARALALAVPHVEQRLVGLMAGPAPEVARRSRLLRARVLVPAAGVLVALTAAGALVLSSRSGPSDAPDRSVDPVVVDSSVPPGGTNEFGDPDPVDPNAPVVLSPAQVATRGPDGNPVQGDRPPDDATSTTTTAP